MHINILLGLAVLAALLWLCKRLFASRQDPAGLLRRALTSRDAARGTLEKAGAALHTLRHERLVELQNAMVRMMDAIPDAMPTPQIRMLEDGAGLELAMPPDYVNGAPSKDSARPPYYLLDWNVPDMNARAFASGSPTMYLSGEYSLQQSGVVLIHQSELIDFLEDVSSLIAAQLA